MLGTLAAFIGLAASALGAWFFTLGLQQTERDEMARQALILAGVLLTLCQLLAFGTAALLPERLLRRLRWALVGLGIVLFGFEVATMSVTQLALVQSSDVQASANEARIEELQAAIASHRATAAGLRDNAAAQSRSVLASSRERGGQALREAMEIEGRIAPMAVELAELQSAKRPTLTTLLGDDRTVLFAVVRSALIALVGLTMMSASGVLFRVARTAERAPWLEPLPAPPAAVARPQRTAAAVAEDDGEDDIAEGDAEARYQRVLAAVRSGSVKPNARAIQRAEGSPAEEARQFLARLERESVTRRTASGRAYEVIG
ncbi:hypothetical protein [Azohydromonas australica]|uniref:hypothetical protein n=1 Tax=Azohydromonas australica TaxID=364039 RepID=UPI0004250992|nr:hypothetical protein [Azohydromonas australica]